MSILTDSSCEPLLYSINLFVPGGKGPVGLNRVSEWVLRLKLKHLKKKTHIESALHSDFVRHLLLVKSICPTKGVGHKPYPQTFLTDPHLGPKVVG